MKIQRAWMLSLSAIVVLVGGASSAFGQFPPLQDSPDYYPAADPYPIMMGQEYYDPTWIGTTNYGDTSCGPAWYDASAEAVYMKRDNAGRAVPVSSDGIAGVGAPNVVLSTSDVDFDYEMGLRFVARHQLSAMYNVEAGYLGVLDWGGFATAYSANDSLYSAFSQFGNVPLGGFADVDQAFMQSLRNRTDIDSVEINLRRSWVCTRWPLLANKVHGSWLAGVRWFQLRETTQFYSAVRQHNDPIGGGLVGPGFTDYHVMTDNDLYGGQLGGQLGFCLFPGLIVNGEIKVGAYADRAVLDSTLSSSTIVTPLVEGGRTDDVSLLAEAGAFLTYQVHPLVKIRAGYEVLYLEGVALSGENFNFQAPSTGTRTININDNGNAFFHGGLLGLEVGW